MEWIKWINEGNVGPLGTFIGTFVGIAIMLVILLTSIKKKGGTE